MAGALAIVGGYAYLNSQQNLACAEESDKNDSSTQRQIEIDFANDLADGETRPL